MKVRTICGALALAATFYASPSFSAAPEALEPEIPNADAGAIAPVTVYELETEMVVKNWILCISAAMAEELVRAREESEEKARSAYAGLQQTRSCGQFGELRVILRERLYASAADTGHDARAFEALVNLSDNWASAFVVYGGLPDSQ